MTKYVSSHGPLEVGDLLADLIGTVGEESVLVADG